VIFRITGSNTNFVRGSTAVSFDPPSVRVLGRPWVINPQQLVVLSVVQRDAAPGFYDVIVATDEDEYILEAGLLIF
jgi:hypothetical protein